VTKVAGYYIGKSKENIDFQAASHLRDFSCLNWFIG